MNDDSQTPVTLRMRLSALWCNFNSETVERQISALERLQQPQGEDSSAAATPIQKFRQWRYATALRRLCLLMVPLLCAALVSTMAYRRVMGRPLAAARPAAIPVGADSNRALLLVSDGRQLSAFVQSPTSVSAEALADAIGLPCRIAHAATTLHRYRMQHPEVEHLLLRMDGRWQMDTLHCLNAANNINGRPLFLHVQVQQRETEPIN